MTRPQMFRGESVEAVSEQLSHHLRGLVDSGEGISHLVLMVVVPTTDADVCTGSLHTRGKLLNNIGAAYGFDAEVDLAPRVGYAPVIFGDPRSGYWRVEWVGPFTNAPGGVA